MWQGMYKRSESPATTCQTHYCMQLCHQMLTNKWIMAEREAASATWVIQAEADVEHELDSCDRGRCRMCGRITRWRCAHVAQSTCEPGKPRRKEASALYLCPASKRRCLIFHFEGVTPANKRQTALQRWKRSSVVSSTTSAND